MLKGSYYELTCSNSLGKIIMFHTKKKETFLSFAQKWHVSDKTIIAVKYSLQSSTIFTEKNVFS